MTKKRLFAGLLTLVMLVGLLPTGALAARADDGAASLEAPSGETVRLETPVWTDAETETPVQAELAEVNTAGLVNIIKTCEISVSSTNYGSSIENLRDGDPSSLWVQGGGFPGTVTFTLPQGVSAVKAVVLKFETIQTRGMTVTLSADGQQVDQQVVSLADTYSYTFGAVETIEALSVTLSTPTDAENNPPQFWPAIAEAEVWAEPINLSGLTNIAKGMSPTLSNSERDALSDKSNLTDDDNTTEFEIYGNWLPTDTTVTPDSAQCYMDFDFGVNRSVGGFELAVTTALENQGYHFYYNIYGKAAGSDQWITLFENCLMDHQVGKNVQSWALGAMTDIQVVRVVLYNGNQYGALSEFRIFGTPQETPPDDPYEGLINVVGECKEVLANGSPTDPALLQDGSIGTWWELGKDTWPTHVDFALPGSLNIKRVEVDFERSDGRTFDLALAYAVNNVTTDYIPWATKSGHAANDTYVYAPDAAQNMTHLRVSLLGTNGQAWPAIAEVRIYAVDETINFKNFHDITEHTTETPGAGYKEWDFGSNQQVVGFRVTIPEGVSAKVLGKAKRDTGWTTYFTALQTGDNALRFPAGMSTVRLESDNLASISEFKIFGSYT